MPIGKELFQKKSTLELTFFVFGRLNCMAIALNQTGCLFIKHQPIFIELDLIKHQNN